MEDAATHTQQLNAQKRQFPSFSHSHNLRRSGGGGGSGSGCLIDFPVGSIVEVRTDEEDFKGVYFVATVLRTGISPKKGSKQKSKRLFVEYQNLLVREGGTDRLKEYVDVSFIRPAPSLQEVKAFEPNDVVDAYYKDGWWTGVVTRAVEGGESFVVTFQNPPDELEFRPTELRVHWDWVNGSWIRPEKQSLAGLMFAVGRKVEVSFDKEDCQDAWFPATIHKDLRNGSFLVEYTSANTDEKTQACRVTIDSLHVRPCPPLLKDKNFVLLEKVDALFDFGWWSGVITKELENSRYVVFFKQMKRDKEFNQSELRPHMEWKDGKWFTSSQLPQELSIPSSVEGMHEHHTPENSNAAAPTIAVNNSDDRGDISDGKTPPLTSGKGHFEQLTPVDQKTSHGTMSVTKRNQRLSDTQNALSQSMKKLNKGNVPGGSQQDIHDKTIKEMCASVSPLPVNNIEISATQTATGDQPSDNPSWGKRIRRKQRSVDATQNISEKNKSTSSNTKKRSIQMLHRENPILDVGGTMVPSSVGNTAEDVQNKHANEETELPIIIGLPCPEIGSSGKSTAKRSYRRNNLETLNNAGDTNQQVNGSAVQKIQDSKQLELGHFSERKRRGRPRKMLIASIQTPVADDLNEKEQDSHKIPEVVDVTELDPSLPDHEKLEFCKVKPTNDTPHMKRKGIVLKRTIDKMSDVEVVNESTVLPKSPPLKRGRSRKITGEKIALQVQDSPDASGGKVTGVNYTMEIEKVISEAPSNNDDDEPLSKWIEGRLSPSAIDGSRNPVASTLEQCVENGKKQQNGDVLEVHSVKQHERGTQTSEKQPESGTQTSEKQPESGTQSSEKQPESGTQTSPLLAKCSVVPSEQQNLPFVKNTALWNMIESMEAFQKIPQKPHFQPLEHFKESSREGLAIGYMVTFSSLVEKAFRLQINDPKSITDDILETLIDLERHGFDVKAVQDRVNGLLSMKDKEEKLVGKVNELDNQISEHSREKNKIEEEIRETQKQIQKLQEKLAVAESAKENKDSEITSLQARLKEIEESINNARREFEGIVSSTL